MTIRKKLPAKLIHKMNIGRILGKQDQESMVAITHQHHGFIWTGRVKFVFTNFRREFFCCHPVCVSRSFAGTLTITIK